MKKKKVLLLGASGMLGNALFLTLFNSNNFLIKGTIRNKNKKILSDDIYKNSIIRNVDVINFKKLERLISKFKPDFIVNCIGITNKQILRTPKSMVFKINCLLPFFLSELSEAKKIKFIHISTDCVFDGKDSEYFEDSYKTATDIYGVTKSIGEEINKSENSLIIRTSIIGHELTKKEGLLEWFLHQKKNVDGYKNVIYSGLTTVELSNIIMKIIKKNKIFGLYHISSNKISKYNLLLIIKKKYNIDININKNLSHKKKLILNSKKFQKDTGIIVKSWSKQIQEMKSFYIDNQLLVLKKIKM
jgi:dTDP-4-dehydrorhamnose reductase